MVNYPFGHPFGVWSRLLRLSDALFPVFGTFQATSWRTQVQVAEAGLNVQTIRCDSTCLKFYQNRLVENQENMVNERYLHSLHSLSRTGLYFRTPGTKSWVTSSTAAIHTCQGQKHGGLRPMDLTLVKNKKLQFWPEIPGQVHTSTVFFGFLATRGLARNSTNMYKSYNIL